MHTTMNLFWINFPDKANLRSEFRYCGGFFHEVLNDLRNLPFFYKQQSLFNRCDFKNVDFSTLTEKF